MQVYGYMATKNTLLHFVNIILHDTRMAEEKEDQAKGAPRQLYLGEMHPQGNADHRPLSGKTT